MDVENQREDREQEQDQMPDQVIGGEAAADGGAEGGDWRVRMQQESRERTVNKIMETLTRHTISFSDEEGLEKLKKVAIRFEEEIFVAASSLSDYLRMISLKILTLEMKFQSPMVNPLQSDAASNSKTTQVPGFQSLQSQIQNMAQQYPTAMMFNQSQAWRQPLSQKIQNSVPSTGLPNTFGLSSALPSVGGKSQATESSAPVQNPFMLNMLNATSKAAENMVGQGWPSNVMPQVAQRPFQGMLPLPAEIQLQQLLQQLSLQQLANTSIRDTAQRIQSTDPKAQQKMTIDQQLQLQMQLQQNLHSQLGIPDEPSFAYQSMQSQMQNQVKQLQIPTVSSQSQVLQQTLSQNISSTGLPNSAAALTTALPCVGGKSHGTVPNFHVQNPNTQNTYNVTPYAVGNSMGQAPLDSSSQIGSATDDWQEETYQKIKAMHEMYYPQLNELYRQVADKVQELDALPEQPINERLKLRAHKTTMERLLKFLQTSKNNILPSHEGKIAGVGKQIKIILKGKWPKEAPSSSRQGQSTQPPMQPQMSQTHTNEGQVNSSMQAMNVLSSLPTQQNNSTSLQQNTITSGSNISDSPQNNVVGKLNPLGASQLMTTTNAQSNGNALQSLSSILHPQWQLQQLRWQQQLQAQQLIQQQQRQLIEQQILKKLRQQRTSQLQPAQLHAQQQHMQGQQSLFQPMQSLQLQPQKTSQLQSGFMQYMQSQQQKQTSQQLQVQASSKQPEQLPGTDEDIEKQPLIPKKRTSRKQSGQKMMPALQTASVILVISALLLLVLVVMLCGEVLHANKLSWE